MPLVASPSISWVHLSDLHMCKVRDGYDSSVVIRTLLDDLRDLKARHNVKPTFIFFTGDLAFGHLGSEKGQSLLNQLEDADDLLHEVRSLYDPPIPAANVFLVPGNHDVYRQDYGMEHAWLAQATADDVRKMLERADGNCLRFMQRLGTYRQFLIDRGYDHLVQDEKRLVYAEKRNIAEITVGIAGFNTAWSSWQDNERGHLWLGRWQVESLAELLHDCDIRIGLMHHPLDWFHEKEDTADIGIAIERDFTFQLNGHDHKAWVQKINDRHVKIASAACYSRTKEKNYYRMGYNVARYSPANGVLEIFLRTWNSDSAEWIPQHVKKLTDEQGRWRIQNFYAMPPKPQPEFLPGQLTLLTGGSTIQDLDSQPKNEEKQTSRFDAFLAAPMAALNDEEYADQRKETLRVAKSLRRHCGLKTIYNAAARISDQADFDPEDIAVKRALSAIRYSRLFVMLYTTDKPSSVLVEAGFALAQRIPSLYFVRNPLQLPFLLRAADVEFKDVHVFLYDSINDVLEYIQKYGRELLDELRGVTIPEDLRAH